MSLIAAWGVRCGLHMVLQRFDNNPISYQAGFEFCLPDFAAAIHILPYQAPAAKDVRSYTHMVGRTIVSRKTSHSFNLPICTNQSPCLCLLAVGVNTQRQSHRRISLRKLMLVLRGRFQGY